jgi:hypothetical protein
MAAMRLSRTLRVPPFALCFPAACGSSSGSSSSGPQGVVARFDVTTAPQTPDRLPAFAKLDPKTLPVVLRSFRNYASATPFTSVPDFTVPRPVAPETPVRDLDPDGVPDATDPNACGK